MSNHLTSLVYKLDLGSLLRKSVMILLADKASDDGSGIWASKQTMADELCCSKRSIINTLQAFIKDGLLKETGHCPNANGYTVTYAIQVDVLDRLPRVSRWKASDRVTGCTGESDAPVQEVQGTGAPGAPKPPLTFPSEAKASSGRSRKAKSVDCEKPDDVSDEVWAEFLAVRRAKRAPFSLYALKGMRRECSAAGLTLEAGMILCIERGWQALNAEWLKDRRGANFQTAPPASPFAYLSAQSREREAFEQRQNN